MFFSCFYVSVYLSSTVCFLLTPAVFCMYFHLFFWIDLLYVIYSFYWLGNLQSFTIISFITIAIITCISDYHDTYVILHSQSQIWQSSFYHKLKLFLNPEFIWYTPVLWFPRQPPKLSCVCRGYVHIYPHILRHTH